MLLEYREQVLIGIVQVLASALLLCLLLVLAAIVAKCTAVKNRHGDVYGSVPGYVWKYRY